MLYFLDSADRNYPKVEAESHEAAAEFLCAEPERVWLVSGALQLAAQASAGEE